MDDLQTRYEQCRTLLRSRDQEHLLRWWGELDDAGRERLLQDVESVPWPLMDALLRSLASSSENASPPARPPRASEHSSHARVATAAGDLDRLEPPHVFPREPAPDQRALYEEAVERGRQRLRRGQVAAMTVAGGQATRLGIDAPKGTVPVTPVGEKSLFELFAEMMLAARRRYAVAVPWYVMTSEANHATTVAFFERHGFFDLPREDVFFFPQGMLPACDLSGRLLLSGKDRLARSPDGHGGSLKALAQSGALDDMRRRGIEVISYFQVDNPLVKPFDPLFLGLHECTGSEMSTKVSEKADDLERVGNVCLRNGKVCVVEYSEFPESLARAKNPDGSRRFNWGNLAIHLLDVAFVERITGGSFQLPYRPARKVVEDVHEQGRRQRPDVPNAIKFETFIFDALPLAKNPLLFEADRREEFSPVKNAVGVDSLETSKRDQLARACRWLEAAGIRVPRRADGSPDVTVAISPLLAMDADDLRGHRDRLPELHPGDAVYLTP